MGKRPGYLINYGLRQIMQREAMKSRLFMKLTALFFLLLFATVLLSGAKKEKFAGKVKSEGVVLDTKNLTISVVNFLLTSQS